MLMQPYGSLTVLLSVSDKITGEDVPFNPHMHFFLYDFIVIVEELLE